MSNPNSRFVSSTVKFDGTELFDIVIVGAGPGGSFCGKVAAEKGFKVLIIEKEFLSPSGRYKPCGGALAWELVEEIDYPEDRISRIIDCLVLHHTDGERYEKRAKGAVVWRSEFDLFLTEQAMAAGALCVDNCSLISISNVSPENQDWVPESGAYLIRTTKGDIKSKYVVAGDGVYSKTLSLLKWPKFPPRSLVLTVTKEIKMSPDKTASILGGKDIHLFFGIKGLVPLGYAWLFPKAEAVSVGWGNNLSTLTNVKEELQRYWSLPMVKSTMSAGEEIRDKPHLIPVDIRPQIYEKGVFAIGDAGGFVDPISGKGIPYAMLTGKHAVESIRHGEQKGKLDTLGDIYLRRLNREFLTVFKYKHELRNRIFANEDNLKRFLDLWQTYRSSEIVLKKLM